MTPSEVAGFIGKLPYMDVNMGSIVYHHIKNFNLRRILEIGTAHGASTCYFAAVAQDLNGQVTTIDLKGSANLHPNVEDSLQRCGLLNPSIRIFREELIEGSAWRLLKLIEGGEAFDFAYIDGSHIWRDVAADFIMVDRLIRPGGWILFDDISWSVNLSSNPSAKYCQHWTPEMKTRSMPGDVWEVLVKHHPSYSNFSKPTPNWGLCQKKEM